MSGTHDPLAITRHRRLRWAIGASSLCALGAAGILVVGSSTGAVADSGNAGQGSAYAQSLQVTPHEGSLAVGAVVGQALAGHTLNFARAQSQGINLGAIGTAMSTDNCNQAPPLKSFVPAPLEAESGQTGAAQGETQSPSQSNYFATEFAQAVNTPYAEADTTYAGDAVGPSNAFIVAGMHTKSWSGVVNGVVEAGAQSDISSINIDNLVKLNGLDWTAVYPLNGGQPTGTFTIGQVVVGGVALPSSLDLTAVDNAINAVLGTVGINLQLPTSSQSQGTEFVSPLELDVVPNPTRDNLIDPIVTQIDPYYYQVANGLENGFASDNPPLNALGQLESGAAGQQLAQALCQSDTPITVLDVSLAAMDGGGYFSASLGGVNASTSPVADNPFSLNALGLGGLNLAGSSQFIPGTGALGGDLSLPSSSTSLPSTATSPTRQNALARTTHPVSAAAGSLLAAGLGGLALLGLLIEGDRQMMRRAQRRAAVVPKE